MQDRAVQKIKKPLAVLISDIHFNINTLELASMALKAALAEAEREKIPLIICGDLNDTKAIIRAEVANEILEILGTATVKVYILVGNHDLINEKGKDNCLHFLASHADIISVPTDFTLNGVRVSMIPYQSSVQDFKDAVDSRESPEILIVHQGIQGAFMGDYFQDKTSVEQEFVEGLTVFSGHYHRHQSIGLWTYIGNPYTLSFGEANDGPKGYLVIGVDGSYKQVPLKLRRHYLIEMDADYVIGLLHDNSPSEVLSYIPPFSPVKLRIKNVTKGHLKILKKPAIGAKFFGHQDFSLELVEISKQVKESVNGIPTQFQGREGNIKLFDALIDQLPGHDKEREELKALWRKVMSCD